jgi:hypothetical protein
VDVVCKAVPVGVRSTAVRVVTFCKAVPVGVCCTTVPVEVVCMAEVGVIALDCAQPGTVRHKMAPNV